MPPPPSASLARSYASAIAAAGHASSVREVLLEWPPGEVLMQADQIAYQNALAEAEMAAARTD